MDFQPQTNYYNEEYSYKQYSSGDVKQYSGTYKPYGDLFKSYGDSYYYYSYNSRQYDGSVFLLRPENISSDPRTTIMIRNIPNKYTIK